MLKKKILFFTGSRADYGLLKPLIKYFKNSKHFNVKLAAAGQHFSKSFGNTSNHIKRDKIEIDFKSKIKLKKTDMKYIIDYLSLSLKDYFKILNKSKPNLVIILGDRYEVFCFAISSFLSNIPIAHIHGGELTYGAFDDGLRHAMTKFSDYHFTSHNSYRNRVIQMGEDPKNVFNVGSLAMDNIYNTEFYNKKLLLEKFKIKTNRKIAMVTFHPVTKGNKNYKEQIVKFLKGLKKNNKFFYIFTYNNTDTFGDDFLDKIKKFVKENKNTILFKTMGTKLYLSFIKISDVVVGNSSSGIFEAPALKTLSLNIGNRQKGRLFSDSVIQCKNNENEINKKLNIIYKKKLTCKFNNIYYKKNTSKNIFNKIKKLIYKKYKIKKFYDIKFK